MNASAAAAARAARMTRWAGLLAALLAAAALAWVVDRLGRGLELTDEAYYLLNALDWQSERPFFSPFHWVTGPLWELTRSLVAFRASGLLLALSSALVLAAGVLRMAERIGLPVPATPAGRGAVLATACSGALLYGSLLNFTPSYNVMATAAACFAVGCALLSMHAQGHRATLLALLAGVACGVCFLSKVPSGISVAALLVLLWLLLAQGRERARLLWMLAAAAATAFAAVQATGGVGQALSQLRGGVEIWAMATDNRSTSSQLLRSAADLGRLLRDTAAAYWAPLACFVLALRWPGARLLRWLGVLWFAVLLLANEHFEGGSDQFALQARPLATALLLVLLAWLPAWTRDLRRLALAAALAGLPVAIAIGSSNPLDIQLLSAMAPWGALVACLGFAKPGLGPAAAVSLLFSLTVMGQVVTSGTQPYRMLPLAQQTEAIELPRLGRVRVDPPTAALARQLRQAAAACGVRSGQPFLEFYDAPGLALLLDTVPVVGPWLSDPVTAARVLAFAGPGELRQAVVAVVRRPGEPPPVPPRQLAAFPAGYRLCGTSAWPLDGARVELWAPAVPGAAP